MDTLAAPNLRWNFLFCKKNRFKYKLANSSGCANAKKRLASCLTSWPQTRLGVLLQTSVIGSQSALTTWPQTLTLDPPVDGWDVTVGTANNESLALATASSFLGRVKSWSAPVRPIHRTHGCEPNVIQRFCTRGCAPTKKTAFSIRLFTTQLIGSCLFSSTNWLRSIIYFTVVISCRQLLKNSKTTKKLKFPAMFPVILPNDVICHVTKIVGAKCWIDPWNLGAHQWVQVLSSEVNPKRGSIHGCAARLNAPLVVVSNVNFLYELFAGIFFILPCIESYTKVDLRTVSFDVPPQEVGFTFLQLTC